MKTTIRKTIWTNFAAMAVIFLIVASGCKKKEDDTPTPVPTPDPLTTTYTLKAKDVLGVTGTVTIAEASSGSAASVVTISITGASATVHPAHIHGNSAVEGGGIVYTLNDVDASGKSTTTFNNVSYSTLVNFDGYVNVHEGGLIVAQADIGSNALTGTNKTYTINPDSSTGVSGTALFEKRKGGKTLVTISLTGLIAGNIYPAYINLGSVTTVGALVTTKTLNSVVGSSGTTSLSVTNIRTLNDGTSISYDQWMVYTGFISIQDAIDTTNVIAKGNIGN